MADPKRVVWVVEDADQRPQVAYVELRGAPLSIRENCVPYIPAPSAERVIAQCRALKSIGKQRNGKPDIEYAIQTARDAIALLEEVLPDGE